MTNQEKDMLNHLALNFKSGNKEALTEIYKMTQKTIMFITVTNFGYTQDADDAFQEVYLKVMKSIQQYDEKRSFYTWLWTIATSTIKDRLRKQYRDNKYVVYDTVTIYRKGEMKEITIKEFADNAPTLGEILENKEFREHLERFIQSRPAKEREVAERRLAEQQYSQIAMEMNIEASTARKYWQRTMEAARNDKNLASLLSAVSLCMVEQDIASAEGQFVLKQIFSALTQGAETATTTTTAATTTTTAATATTTAATTATTATVATAAASQTTIGGIGIMASIISTKIGVAVITAAVAAAGVGVPMYITAENRQAEQAAVIGQGQQARQSLETRLSEIEQKLSTEQATRQEVETMLTETVKALESEQAETQEKTAQIEQLQTANEEMQKQIDAETAAQEALAALQSAQAQQAQQQQQQASSASQASSAELSNEQKAEAIFGGRTAKGRQGGPAGF